MKYARGNNMTIIKHYLNIFVALTLSILIIFLSLTSSSVHAISKYGSSGDEVIKIQQKLSELGYYSGNIDGKFGNDTKKAVMQFQKDNDLSSDGIVGIKTLEALGIGTSSNSSTFTESEISLLARIISAESRGEPYEGQVAVGAVILNRIDHPSFPNTISGVIFQPLAFSCVNDGQINEPVSDTALKAAQDAINGWDPSGGAIYYYNPAKSTSKWIFSRTIVCSIGKHKFCI